MPSLPSSGASVARGQDPATGGSSAPVLEFLCLFTHDLRRKQKRWQDGRLKFHTFNKRVMVYDDRGNFIGDMHWQRDYDFDEGEEVQLERGGVVVQVSECVGRQNQDLSELLDKRAREKEQRQSRTVARPIAPAAQAIPLRTPIPAPRVRLEHADHPQPLHRPLHQFIGTPTGHHGRALVPTDSPFERRQQQANETPDNGTDSRAAKRRKYDDTPPSKMGYAQALFGAQLSLSAVPMSSAPLRRSASTASRVQSEQVTSQEQDRRQEEALDEVREITASSAARAGLSRANTIAPLPKARPEPRHTVPERTRKLVEPRPGKGVVTQAQSVPQPAEPPEQPAHKPGKRDLGPGNRQSATSKTGTAPAEPESPALSNSVSAGSKSRRLADTGDWTTARTLSRNPRSKSIISDDDTSEGEENGSTAAKLQEIATNAPVSKLAVPDARNQKPAKRKKSPLPLIWPESAQPVPKRLSSRFGDAEQEKQAAPEREEQEEPRVELRIRPRQKRGLLMLSDIGGNKPKRPKARHESAGGPEIALNLPQPSSGVFSAKPSIRPAQNPVCSQDSENEGHLPVPSPWFPTEADTEAPMFEKGFNKSTLPGNVTAGRPKTTESIYNLPDSTDDDFVTRPPPRQGNKVAQETANDAPEIQSARDSGKPIRQSERSNPVREICEPENNEASEDEVPTRKLRKRKTLPLDESESEEEEEEEFPQVPVGPRLARLGRKSVKSREVIGFIPSSSPVPEPTFAVGLFSSHPVHLDDKHSRSAAKNSEAAPEIEVTVKIIDKVPSQLDLDTSLHSSLDIRQPFPAPLADADVPLEVDASSSDINEGALDGKEMTTAASSLLIEGGVSTFVAEKNLPSQAMEGQVSMNELRIDEAASSTGRSARNPSNHLDDADLAYAGTTANMQNSAARGKDSAPKTMGPVADTRATPAAVATPTLQSLSHKHDGPTNQQTTPINPSHDVVVLPVTTNVPKNPAAQISSAESSSRPRIANPATRGRKAALKSDAAGQVPQSIVPPPEPVLVRPSIRPPQAARPDATVNERPKRVMRFPGFTTARVGGGPWSREAGDLLETGRPP